MAKYKEGKAVKEVEQVVPVEAVKPPQKSLEIEISRASGKTIFNFSVDEKIQELYKGLASEVRESASWEGLKFYYCPDITGDAKYKEKLRYAQLFDDYGTGLFKDGFLNIAWVRTVGGKGTIVVKNSANLADLSVQFRNATQFIKEHWENQFKDFKIKGSIAIEI